MVVGVRRNGKLFAPDADDELHAGDEAYVFAPVDDIPRTLEVFGKSSHVQERLVIVGGGAVGISGSVNTSGAGGVDIESLITRSQGSTSMDV